jgi:hypothetical protein
MDPSTSAEARLAATIQLERWLEKDEVACSFLNSSERERLWRGCVRMDDKESVAKAYERLDAGVFKIIESKEVAEVSHTPLPSKSSWMFYNQCCLGKLNRIPSSSLFFLKI